VTVRIGFLGAVLIATYHGKSLRRSGADHVIAAVYDLHAERTVAFAQASGAEPMGSEEAVLVMAVSHRVAMRGVIASTGFGSGHRVVVGHWAEGPLGPMTDLMWAAPDGRRTLVAPSPEVAAFISSVYDFDEVEVVEISVEATDRTLAIRAGRRYLALVAGRAIRIPVSRPAWCTRFVEAPIARSLLGVRTYGTSPKGVREWYRADAYQRVRAAQGSLDGVDLGTMASVSPPTRFGFSEPPKRPSWVAVRPLLIGPMTLPARPRGG